MVDHNRGPHVLPGRGIPDPSPETYCIAHATAAKMLTKLAHKIAVQLAEGPCRNPVESGHAQLRRVLQEFSSDLTLELVDFNWPADSFDQDTAEQIALDLVIDALLAIRAAALRETR